MKGKKQVELKDLELSLDKVISSFERSQPLLSDIFRFMKNTGLRVREVIEPDRWKVKDKSTITVYLAKGEQTRDFAIKDIPADLYAAYTGKRSLDLYTYSAVNHSLRKALPLYYTDGAVAPTTCHIFRYFYIMNLSKSGVKIAEIQRIIGHLDVRTTKSYAQETIYA